MNWDEVKRLPNDPKSHQKKGDEDMEDDLYKYPFLAGERVCLNPEASRYKALNDTSQGTAGYVKSHEMSDESVLMWGENSSSFHRDKVILVHFDNGMEQRIRHKELLPIDGKEKTVEFYELSNGNVYRLFEDESHQIIDELVIMRGVMIYNKKIWDKEWRENIKKRIYGENTSSSSQNTW